MADIQIDAARAERIIAQIREQVHLGLSERHVSAGRMQHDPAVRDGGFDRPGVFLIAAASLSELLIDHGHRKPTGMIRLDRIRQLKQLPLGGFRRRERAILFEFHLGSMIAMPMASAGRRSPLGPRGILIYPSIMV
jgi:hypothetical protein